MSTLPPNNSATASLTQILNNAEHTRDGFDEAFHCVYGELRRIAHRLLSGHDAPTLNPTALVHEAYAKLIAGEKLSVEGRRHFYALCARTMRHIIVDYARARLADKRGGGIAPVELTEDGVIDVTRPETLVAMDEALDWLEQREQRLADLIHYRVYAGMPLPEIAPLMGVTVRQLQRDWQRARIWLSEALIHPEP